MVTRIVETKKPKLKNPLFIEGLPGVGNVGRIAAGYLVEELGAEKFAEMFSSHFMPFVLMHQSSAVHVLKNEFYFWKAKKPKQRDLIILIGDSQSVDPEGHYEVAEEILKYVESLGVKDIITLAGLSIGEKKEDPKVIGAVSDAALIKQYSKFGIDFESGSKVGTIVGASGLILGLGAYHGMKGVCLLGETTGIPIIPDPKSAEAILDVLMKILNVKIDTSKIDQKVKEMENFIKKVEDVQKRAITQLMKKQGAGKEGAEGDDELNYIG